MPGVVKGTDQVLIEVEGVVVEEVDDVGIGGSGGDITDTEGGELEGEGFGGGDVLLGVLKNVDGVLFFAIVDQSGGEACVGGLKLRIEGEGCAVGGLCGLILFIFSVGVGEIEVGGGRRWGKAERLFG